jgi:hypothetical protein
MKNSKAKRGYSVWVYTVFGWQRGLAKTKSAAIRDVETALGKAYAYDDDCNLIAKNYGNDKTVNGVNYND